MLLKAFTASMSDDITHMKSCQFTAFFPTQHQNTEINVKINVKILKLKLWVPEL